MLFRSPPGRGRPAELRSWRRPTAGTGFFCFSCSIPPFRHMVGLSQTEPYHRRREKSNTIGRQWWARNRQLSARRRHWGQGIAPASCANVLLRDACALAAPRRRGPWPRQWRGFFQWKIDFICWDENGVTTETGMERFFSMQFLPPAGCNRFTSFSVKGEIGCQSYTLFSRFFKKAVPRYMDRQGVTHDPLPSALRPIRWCVWPLIHA